MKKSFLVLLLCIFTAFTFAACGGGGCECGEFDDLKDRIDALERAGGDKVYELGETYIYTVGGVKLFTIKLDNHQGGDNPTVDVTVQNFIFAGEWRVYSWIFVDSEYTYSYIFTDEVPEQGETVTSTRPCGTGEFYFISLNSEFPTIVFRLPA